MSSKSHKFSRNLSVKSGLRAVALAAPLLGLIGCSAFTPSAAPPQCLADTDCSNARVCVQEVCVVACRVDAECAEGLRCVFSQCQPPPAIARDAGAQGDAALADMAVGDMLTSDATAADMLASDARVADMATPDMRAPDMQVMADMAAPDMAATDMAAPDMIAADMDAPDAQVEADASAEMAADAQ